MGGLLRPLLQRRRLLEYAKQDGRPLWELAARYESVRGNTTEEDIFNKMDRLVGIMEKAVEDGLAGTEYADRHLSRTPTASSARRRT